MIRFVFLLCIFLYTYLYDISLLTITRHPDYGTIIYGNDVIWSFIDRKLSVVNRIRAMDARWRISWRFNDFHSE